MSAIYYGHGIATDEIENTDIDRVKKLLAMAPGIYEELSPIFDEIEEDCDGDANEFASQLADEWCSKEFGDMGSAGYASLLAGVINECEGIRMVSMTDNTAYAYLIMPERAPWQFNHKEKSLTEEGLFTIIRKYVNVLTDDVLTIEYRSIELD